VIKKILILGALLCSFVTLQVQADACSVDRLELARIQNLKVASGLDRSTSRLFGEIARLYLDMPIPSNLGKLGVSAAQNTVIWGQEVIYDPLDPLEQDFVGAVEDITNAIGGSLEDPDHLIVRINGSTVVPYSTAEPHYLMHQGGGLPFQPNVIKRSFRKAAALQLIERDDGVNDNLGWVNVISSPVLNSRVPVDPTSTLYLDVYYELASSTANEGDLLFDYTGSYSFFIGSGFDDLALNETRQVTFSYRTFGTDQFSGQRDVEIGSAKTITITMTGTGTNEPPVAVDNTGATSNTSTTPLAGNTIRIFAVDPDDGSIYDVTYKIERGTGDLDEIAENLVCSDRECKDVLELRRFTGGSSRAIECPLGYRDDTTDYNGGRELRYCSLITPPGCGGVFDPIASVDELVNGAVIVLKNNTLNEGKEKYLASCKNCAQGALFDSAYLHTDDPNRSKAQWTVRTLANGKFALRSENGLYLRKCDFCVLDGTTAKRDWAVALGFDRLEDEAELTIAPAGNGKYTLQDNTGKYLVQCPFCSGGLTFTTLFMGVPADPEQAAWTIALKQRKLISKPLDTRITIDEIINPSDHWVIEANGVLTIEVGDTLTIQAGAKLENKGTIINNGTIAVNDAGELENLGTIINKEILRVRRGILVNQAGAIIDNSGANHIRNDGALLNAGVIFDPWKRYYGSLSYPNNPETGYYFGPDITGQISCAIIGSDSSNWNNATNTCTLGSAWIRSDRNLTVANGVKLVLNGTLTNDGDILNNGIIDNAAGLLRQCNTISGNTPTTAGNVEDPCIVTAEEQQCNDFGGAWNRPVINTCNNVTGGTVPAGEVLTIRDGITWRITGGAIDNFGGINVEKNAAIYLSGGTINNSNDGSDGLFINDGLISLGMDDNLGIESLLLNNSQISNYGTITNDNGSQGYIYGTGYVDNLCGSTYTVDRTPFGIGFDNLNTFFDETCRPPDFDNDGVADELDAFPYDSAETADSDNDGYGDNLADAFPLNDRENADSDGDCGVISSQTTTSGDGCGDNSDAFVLNSQETTDTDGDCGDIPIQSATSGNGCGDSSDVFPLDGFEIADFDGDGVGDNGDAFPQDRFETVDSDNDGVGDNGDNCSLVSNLVQNDSDGDGYGNYCDPDFDNNLIVNAADLAYFKTRFFSADAVADLNSNGIVNAADLAILKTMFFKPPGPSGLAP
jgi:hypothetical protein